MLGVRGLKRYRSVKVILSSVTAVVILVLAVLLVAVSYNTVYNAVENAYVNQLDNFNREIERQLVGFYEQQKGACEFLANDERIVQAALLGNYGAVRGMLENYFDKTGFLENVFVSTASEDTEIKVDGIRGKSVGLKWAGKGFDDNIKETLLKGKTHVGTPYKSPATGLPVVLITAPIKSGGAIVGIMGLPVDLGIYAHNLVKNIKVGKTGYPFITVPSGITIAHPNRDFIFKVDIKTYPWGRELLEKESGTVIRYNWQGDPKIAIAVRNDLFGFIVASTIFLTDINVEARTMAAIMALVALLGVAVSGFLVYRLIAGKLKPLEECNSVLSAMAGGNLTGRYRGRISRDEIGEIAAAMNESLDSFEKLISEVVVSAQNLTQAVQEISSGNENLSQRTSEQASSLEEVASTIEEATASIRQNAENAVEAKSLTDSGAAKSAEGGHVAQAAVEAINEITQSSKKIGEIITVINEIAFQTNLLALNAAVEAARAGEQGRGFAVVAGEVRNLAQRSAEASREISKLISDSSAKVERGTEMVNRSGLTLAEIVAAAKSTAGLISEIAAASEEQKRGIDQINVAISELDTMTQQNAALVEQTASASEEMASQAQELLSMVERFKISKEIQEDSHKRKHQEVRLLSAGRGREGGRGGVRQETRGGKNGAEVTKPGQDMKSKMADEGFEEF